jgi:hypothetical protein
MRAVKVVIGERDRAATQAALHDPEAWEQIREQAGDAKPHVSNRFRSFWPIQTPVCTFSLVPGLAYVLLLSPTDFARAQARDPKLMVGISHFYCEQ